MTGQEPGIEMLDKTLLVITPDFPDKTGQYIGSIYVKNQIEPLMRYFKRIIVICPVLFSFRFLPNDKYCSNYQYGNVTVYYPRCFFIPRSLPIPLISSGMKMKFDGRYFAVRQLIRKENLRFDVIHAHFTWPSADIAVRLKEEFHVPVVATIHEDSGWLEEEVQMQHPRLIRAWRECDQLIRVNEKEVPLLSHYNPHTISLPNGFGPEFHPLNMTECRNSLHLPTDTKIVFSLGPLIPRKGFSYLIDAMEQIIEKDPTVSCYIGGAGPEKQTLLNHIQKKNLQNNIFLLGFVPDNQVVLWMNSADIFVLSSLKEGNPTVMFECLGCGTPFIGTAVGGIPEVITSDSIGYVCSPGDTDSLAHSITLALSRSWDRKAILAYADQFRWESIAEKLLWVYRAVLEERKTVSDAKN